MDNSQNNFEYIGDELEVFSYAKNWKQYWSHMIRPYLGSSVLEVGAGIGASTTALYHPTYAEWVALEPDTQMFNDLIVRQNNGDLPKQIDFVQGTVQDIPAEQLFDSIIYIDVLEHIEDDENEIKWAGKHLKDGGYLIVLSPAYQFLYTEFDEAIGHYRRYRKHQLEALTPQNLVFHRGFYLDSVGMLTSVVNRFLLHSALPSKQQILFWDRLIVQLSRYLVDPLTRRSFGRSVIGIWQNRD